MFASDRTDGPIARLGKSQNKFREACALKQEWRLHDLRRACRTVMGGLASSLTSPNVWSVIWSAMSLNASMTVAPR